MLNAAGDAFSVLHACGAGLDLTRYADLPFAVANWDATARNPGVAAGSALLGRLSMGGIDPAGPLSVNDVAEALLALTVDCPGLALVAPGCAFGDRVSIDALARFSAAVRAGTTGTQKD